MFPDIHHLAKKQNQRKMLKHLPRGISLKHLSRWERLVEAISHINLNVSVGSSGKMSGSSKTGTHY